MSSLVEVCCVCGFVHRNDLTGERYAKAHYHWRLFGRQNDLATDTSQVELHATVCAKCLDEIEPSPRRRSIWRRFMPALAATPSYYRKGRLNASLPLDVSEDVRTLLNAMHSEMCVVFHMTLEPRGNDEPRDTNDG